MYNYLSLLLLYYLIYNILLLSYRFESNCICKLSRWLFQSRSKLSHLSNLNLSFNNLNLFPDAIFDITSIEYLYINGIF